MKTVYLDNNATTPLHPQVKLAINQAQKLFGNPSSLHEEGRKSKEAIEKSRQTIADFIGANSKEIIFTGSGSEANNMVLNSFFLDFLKQKNSSLNIGNDNISSASLQNQATKKIIKNHIITSNIEHSCVLETCKKFQKYGLEVDFIPVKENGVIDLEKLSQAIKPQTGLITVMAANNEIGTIQPIEEIGRLAKENQLLFHTDAVQALGKIPINVQNWNANFMTMSAHKVYAPKGIGALYVKKGTPLAPLITGGHQEKNRRAGTENTLGIIAFGKAVEVLRSEMTENNQKIEKLRNKLRDNILKTIPDVLINGDQQYCVPNTLNVTFKYIEGESILLKLDLEKICVSTGSACSSDSLEPSHVILALGIPKKDAHGSIRFSLGRQTTEKEIDYVLNKLPKIIQDLREISPLKK